MIEFAILSILSSFQIFFIAPLLIGHLFRVQGYKITDQTECNTLIKKLNIKCSTFIQNEKPFGFFYGKWFIGYICSQESPTQQNSGQVMYVVIRRAHFQRIKKCSEVEIDDNGEQVGQKIIKITRGGGNTRNDNTMPQNICKKNLEIINPKLSRTCFPSSTVKLQKAALFSSTANREPESRCSRFF